MEVTPDYVNQLAAPTEAFLCPLSANVYKIDFVAFKIRSVEETREDLLFEIRKDPEDDDDVPDDGDDSSRSIKYHFGPQFLDFSTIGTSLEFSVGDQPLHNFRMIERHYFRDQLIRSYDFTLPFVIPNTTNTWEVIYSMPELDQAVKDAIIACPWETRSDSFYFVDGVLVMHNKADYNYSHSP
mmetsp:Transcript_56274/g.126969  ORF Transcript_56274/g.126969 Transcript_56274/m.126969 type:complete len:183 (+) Transcript_56274:121-669(+)